MVGPLQPSTCYRAKLGGEEGAWVRVMVGMLGRANRKRKGVSKPQLAMRNWPIGTTIVSQVC